ncbi:ubiquitin thioesterase OTUB1 isoform X2 [Triticum aestivum]|uniref:ubiquitin thioesterase OTUB1 isoform X2 n=1 Tax=Triticum aestivum TaxID=4565 RepID=UPI001D016542|nr:ubiquitin thioesterase OTUB1-like isoform X2 [Triticum aestivum]
MAGSGGSPDADDPNCGGDEAEPSRTPQESDDRYSAPASPLSTRPSDRYKNPAAASFLLGPSSSTMGASSSSSSDSWIGSDRTCGGASTSSSLDASNYMGFYRNPPSEWMYTQILESSFGWNEYETCDDMRAYSGRDKYEPSQNFSSTIHQKAPLSALAATLISENMKAQTYKLLANYSVYREICPDGNCFYRSFIFSYLEQLEASANEEQRLFCVLEPMGEKFQSLHWFDSYSDLHIAFVCFILECVEQTRELSVSAYQDWLFQESQNEQKFANILSYLRLVTAIEICSKAEKYKPFILDPGYKRNLVGYCRANVIPMKQEAEHINLFALTDVLQVPLQVVYIQDKPTEPNTHIIYESPDSSVPTVTLLYRPGHYDIIYEK